LALAASVGLMPSGVAAETLRQALAAAYQTNPRLDAERARLRATDEEVARAKSGFRPIIQGSADYGTKHVRTSPDSSSSGSTRPAGYTLNVTQEIFSGFRTVNSVREAEATVRAGRENLRSVETSTLLDAVTAYMDVIRDQAIVRLREGQLDVLTKELAAAEARREAREVTRTDVAQARARRAKAASELEQAKANLKASRAAYERIVGNPSRNLTEPPPKSKLVPRSLEEAQRIGEQESPKVVAALYREQAARYGVDRIWGELLPEVRLEASYSHRSDPGSSIDKEDTATFGGRISVPLYQGGETHARVRQAKHTHVSRIQEIEQARTETRAGVTEAWSRLTAARAQLKSDQVQAEANQVALDGVREEERVGQRTIIDVLNAEQELLDSQVQLVVTRRELVVATYTLIAAIGRMTATSLELSSAIYDPEEHYHEIRSKWFGLSITHADGRRRPFQATDPSRAQPDPD
jgi:outer membrane protein